MNSIKNVKDVLNIIKDYYSSMNQKTIQLILIIVVVLLVNVVSTTFNYRLDITANQVYSLSDKSKEVVATLNEKLTVRVLFSEDLPAQHEAVFRYLKDILDEYSYYGNENFNYEIVEEKYLEKEARNYGIRPIVSKELVNDQVITRQPYMGIIIQQADVIEKLGAVVNTTGMEYNITSLMQKVTSKVNSLLQLKEGDIKVRVYLDSNLRFLPLKGIGEYPEKLEEAVKKSNEQNYNKLKLELIDPSKSDSAKAIIEQYGLPAIPWKGGKGSFNKFVPKGDYIIGAVIEKGDKFIPIDLVTAHPLFGIQLVSSEYVKDKIDEAVGNLVATNQSIGYISGHGEVDINDVRTPEGGGLLKEILSDVYEIKAINLTNEDIPSNMKTIIINGPKRAFSQGELFKVDQFLMKGKSVIFFVDSFQEVRMGRGGMMGPQSGAVPLVTGIGLLLESYGVKINKDMVLDKSCPKVQIQTFITDFHEVPLIKESGLFDDNIITKYLKGILFARASSITLDSDRIGKQGVVAKELIKSSEESWLMKGQIQYNPIMQKYDLKKHGPMKSFPIAVLLSGNLESYFKGKEVGENKEGKKSQSSLTTVARLDETISAGKSEILVVSSSQITGSKFLIDSERVLKRSLPSQKDGQYMFPNAAILHNMVDYMTGNYFIPEMQNKRLSYNPLDEVDETMRLVFKVFNMAGVPFLILFFGIFTWRRFYGRKKAIMERFSGGGK